MAPDVAVVTRVATWLAAHDKNKPWEDNLGCSFEDAPLLTSDLRALVQAVRTTAAHDPGANLFGEDFGGRTATTVCQTCGADLAVLSCCEWVDRANMKAASVPLWHDHTPAGAKEHIHRELTP